MEIRLGVIGCGCGKSVIIPASRADGRCRVTAVAASSLNRRGRPPRSCVLPMLMRTFCHDTPCGNRINTGARKSHQ